MKDQPCSEFEEDAFTEWLLKLRASNHIAYLVYPQAIRDAVEEYEREKKAVQSGKSEQK